MGLEYCPFLICCAGSSLIEKKQNVKALVKMVKGKCILSDCLLSVAMVNLLNPDFPLKLSSFKIEIFFFFFSFFVATSHMMCSVSASFNVSFKVPYVMPILSETIKSK